MLTLLLAESSLELIPQEISSHSSVVAHVKRRGKKSMHMLLDSSLHHSAMKTLPDNNRRVRPDLIHTFLLTAFESVLNLEGSLNVLVHTRHDGLIRFEPTIRLPKNYNRFVGLMEQLLVDGVVPKEIPKEGQRPLIRLEKNKTLHASVNDLRDESKNLGKNLRVVVLCDAGRTVKACDYFRSAAESSDDHLFIIGGFPEGDFKTNLSAMDADDMISLYPKPLKTWTVASEIIVNYRAALNKNNKEFKSGG